MGTGDEGRVIGAVIGNHDHLKKRGRIRLAKQALNQEAHHPRLVSGGNQHSKAFLRRKVLPGRQGAKGPQKGDKRKPDSVKGADSAQNQ